MEEGAVVRGTVRSLASYGAFVDIGGLDGLLHVGDISWARVTDPSTELSVGDVLDLKILKVDKENGKISLGLKQMSPDPWQDAAARLKMHPFVAEKAFAQAANFSEEELGDVLVRLAQLDAAAKGGSRLPAELELGFMAYGHRSKGDCNDIEMLVDKRIGRSAEEDVTRICRGRPGAVGIQETCGYAGFQE